MLSRTENSGGHICCRSSRIAVNAQGPPNFTTCLMASEAGASSPPLVDSHGEPSASGFDMYACTSRTYAGRHETPHEESRSGSSGRCQARWTC